MKIRNYRSNPNFKTLSIKIVDKEVNENERSITHYISTNTVDRGGDIIDQNGIDETNFKKNRVVLFNHNPYYVAGKNDWIKTDSKGALARTAFAETVFADDIYQLNKGGFLNAWSIGFIPIKWKFDEAAKVMRFSLIDLLEYSSVALPMNPDAVTEARALIKSDMLKEMIMTEKDFQASEIIKELKNDIRDINKNVETIYSKLIDFLDNNDPLDFQEKLQMELFALRKLMENKPKEISSKQKLNQIRREILNGNQF